MKNKGLVYGGIGVGVAIALLAASDDAHAAGKKVKRKGVKSPLGNVTDAQWGEFVRVMMDPSNKISPTAHYGVFHFSAPRLKDLGLMTRVHKEASGPNNRNIWVGTFVPPMTDLAFVGSLVNQLKAFERSMADYGNRVPRSLIGKTLDGQRISLSGLLAVAHRSGAQGLRRWLAKPSDRAAYPNTTRAFNVANGIF